MTKSSSFPSAVQTAQPLPCGIVTCRDRHWVVLPQENSNLIQLRPINGSEEQICGIYQPLGLEEIQSAEFPLPDPATVSDHTSIQLLMDAARLNLRSGASPFRCSGKLAVQPRPFQLVPLLMALRMPTVRMLIADDVGIGKTIEAGLIARELLDRREIKRIAILCPPQLCQQWQKEMQDKFQIDAVVVRSGTAAKLERGLPSGEHSIFSYYPHIIVSLDYVKSDRRRAAFLAQCPDFVIVDEAHTCSNTVQGERLRKPQAKPSEHSSGDSSSQHQRYQLVKEISGRLDCHLVLLSATPHSGIAEGFLSLIGLLKPEFGELELDNFALKDRAELAKYFVQRRRGDVKQWLGADTPFPERDATEVSYKLSPKYLELYEEVYSFARRLVTTTDGLSKAQQQGRYWSALAILRCVMSSPAAAIATLGKQIENRGDSVDLLDDELMSSYVYDPTEQEQSTDATPTVEIGSQDSDRRKLAQFLKNAKAIDPKQDRKLQVMIDRVKNLLAEGLNPIVWCRYIATANYVAEQLRQELEKKKNGSTRVIAITGEQSEDERETRLEELKGYSQRVMVATDCLSEGVNLQTHFQAAIHYDLPWNPNRLEQREGRIDRYGQPAPVVKTCLLYGSDNKIDLAVLEVLIRKAVTIRKTLGVSVPLPITGGASGAIDSSTVQTAIFKSLFEHPGTVEQLKLDLFKDEASPISEVHRRWDSAVSREKQSMTKFAQAGIKPEEIEKELQETDRVLGNAADVERFVRTACERLGHGMKREKQCDVPRTGLREPQTNVKHWILSSLPDCLRNVIKEKTLIAFHEPVAEGVEYIGRNHLIVERLASFLLEESLTNQQNPTAARCGYIITKDVTQRTNLLLLRLRYLIGNLDGAATAPLMAEECIVAGFTGSPRNPQWLSSDQALELLKSASASSNANAEIKRKAVSDLIDRWPELSGHLENLAAERAQGLSATYDRIRVATRGKRQQSIEPQIPMDLLGLLILVPE